MKPDCYMDFVATPSGDDEMSSSHATLGVALRVLHGAFSKNPGKYAVAFPKAKAGNARSMGDTIRVFAGSSMELYQLIDAVKGHHVLRDHVVTRMPVSIPANFSGSWSSWQRLHIPSSSTVAQANTISRETYRAAQRLKAQGLPFTEMRSSSGNIFAFRINRNKAAPWMAEVNPNTYGLASKEQPFSLPDL